MSMFRPPFRYPAPENYELRVRCLEALGATTSDAQAAADAQDLQPHTELDVELRTLMDSVNLADLQSDGGRADATSVLLLAQHRAEQEAVKAIGAHLTMAKGAELRGEQVHGELSATNPLGIHPTGWSSIDTSTEAVEAVRTAREIDASMGLDDEFARLQAKADVTVYVQAAKTAKASGEMAEQLASQVVADATDAAVNAACAVIQKALGVKTGDFAALYFDDSAVADWREFLRSYFNAEASRLL
jgi:hypothetical protein